MDKYKVFGKPFDDEERELMDAVKKGNFKPVSAAEKNRILKGAKAGAKNISIRIKNSELESLKERASVAGMPYQTLINSVIHRYLTGDIVIKTPV